MKPFLDETAVGQNESYTYQLFSVMIHSGSALGGHYYAYIWSFEKEKWFCFNDSSVTPVGHMSTQQAKKGVRDCLGESQSWHKLYNARQCLYNTVTVWTLPASFFFALESGLLIL